MTIPGVDESVTPIIGDGSATTAGTGGVTSGASQTITQANSDTGQANSAVMEQMIKELLQGPKNSIVPGTSGPVLPAARQPQQPTPYQYKPTGSVDKKQTTALGILASVGNTVNKIKQQKETREAALVQADLELIKAAGAKTGDPDVDKHNQEVLNALYNDPKRMKRIEKAIGLNPFTGAEGGAEKGLLNFLTKHNKGQKNPAAANAPKQATGSQAQDMLANRSPMGLQPSPQLQMQAFLVKAGLIPSADKMADFFKESLKDQASWEKTKAEIESKEKIALRNNQTQEYVQLSKMRIQLEMANEKIRSAEKIAKEKEAGANARQDKRLESTETQKGLDRESREKLAKEKMPARAKQQYDMVKAQNTSYQRELTSLENELKKMQSDDKLKKDTGTINRIMDDIGKKKAEIESSNTLMQMLIDKSLGTKDPGGVEEPSPTDSPDSSNELDNLFKGDIPN